MYRLVVLLLLGCSGEAFNAQGNSEANSSGGSGEVSGSGSNFATAGTNSDMGGRGGTDAAPSGGTSQAATSGASALAGGPSLGAAGEGGVGGLEQGGETNGGPASCLANWQNLDCARVCTNSQSDCQAVINCYVTSNSLDNCQEFTTVGISLAQDAERNCCHD